MNDPLGQTHSPLASSDHLKYLKYCEVLRSDGRTDRRTETWTPRVNYPS